MLSYIVMDLMAVVWKLSNMPNLLVLRELVFVVLIFKQQEIQKENTLHSGIKNLYLTKRHLE